MRTRRKLLVGGIVFGSLLTLAPVVGVIGVALGMIRVHKTLGSSGISDPQVIGEGIGTALVSMATGLFLFPAGVVTLAISLWLFYASRKTTPPPLPSQHEKAALGE